MSASNMLPLDREAVQLCAWPVKHRHTCRCGRSWVHKYDGCSAHACPSCDEEQFEITLDHVRPTTQRRRVNLSPAVHAL